MSVTPFVRTYTDQKIPHPDLTRNTIFDHAEMRKNGMPTSLRRFNEARDQDRLKLPQVLDPCPYAVKGMLGTTDYLRTRKGWILPSDETIRRAMSNNTQKNIAKRLHPSAQSPLSMLLAGTLPSGHPQKGILEPHGFMFRGEPSRRKVPPPSTRIREKELWTPRYVQRLELTKRINIQLCSAHERHRATLEERSERARVACDSKQNNVRLRTLDIEPIADRVKRRNLDAECKALGLPLKIEDPEGLLLKLKAEFGIKEKESKKDQKQETTAHDKSKGPTPILKSQGMQPSKQLKIVQPKRLLPHEYKSISIVKEFTVIRSAEVEKEFEVIRSKSESDIGTRVRRRGGKLQTTDGSQRDLDSGLSSDGELQGSQSCNALFFMFASVPPPLSPVESCNLLYITLAEDPAVSAIPCSLSFVAMAEQETANIQRQPSSDTDSLACQFGSKTDPAMGMSAEEMEPTSSLATEDEGCSTPLRMMKYVLHPCNSIVPCL